MNDDRGIRNIELRLLLVAWLVIALCLTAIAVSNRSAPGLYYDEAVFAGMAKDFVNRTPGRLHMPGVQFVNLFGRPFPIFVQSYFGACKSWLIIPSFALFGCSVPVLRMTALFWCLIGLLFFMLWTRKLLGLPTALIASALLAFDPSFFFVSVMDWGGVVPSFLCRMSGFYFLLRWSREKKVRYGLLAAGLLGLGVYSKIDFVLVLLGCGIAVLRVYREELHALVEKVPRQAACCGALFLLICSVMSIFTLDILDQTWVMFRTAATGGVTVKLKTAQAMYDGSYFYRLMDVGGIFENMFDRTCPVWSAAGMAVLGCALVLAVRVLRRSGPPRETQATKFFLLSLVLITLGVLLLPGATRIHHSILVYPFPHLIVATCIVILWREVLVVGTGRWKGLAKWAGRSLAVAIVCVILAGHVDAIVKTERVIQNTGGRGLWSNAFEQFCNDIRDEPNLPIVSVDWGFNEQMDVFGVRNKLLEPIWPRMRPRRLANAVYLVHPPEYTFFPRAGEFFKAAQQNSAHPLSIRAYHDREGRVAFYAFRFVEKRRPRP